MKLNLTEYQASVDGPGTEDVHRDLLNISAGVTQ